VGGQGAGSPETRSVTIPAGAIELQGDLAVPPRCVGLVLFAHGSGSSRLSPRNRKVAEALQRERFATLLFDLLTASEEREDATTGRFRFDIVLLGRRLALATDWVETNPALRALPLGYFGASTGAAAALWAGAERPGAVRAIVSRGGRPDLAGGQIPQVRAPTLLIVGSNDPQVLEFNRQVLQTFAVDHELSLVKGATHLFEETGALEEVARLACRWFGMHLAVGRR